MTSTSAPSDSCTVRLHRVLKAPPERVFRAFTDPSALVKWMAPHGFTAQVHSIDARAGGSYKMSFTNFSTGQTHSFGGRYAEVTPPTEESPHGRLRYTDKFDDPSLPGEMSMMVDVRGVLKGVLGPQGGSDLTIVQANIPPQIPVEMCYLGWQESLSLLIQLVEPEIP